MTDVRPCWLGVAPVYLWVALKTGSRCFVTTAWCPPNLKLISQDASAIFPPSLLKPPFLQMMERFSILQ